jgi:hypothetical protein
VVIWRCRKQIGGDAFIAGATAEATPARRRESNSQNNAKRAANAVRTARHPERESRKWSIFAMAFLPVNHSLANDSVARRHEQAGERRQIFQQLGVKQR